MFLSHGVSKVSLGAGRRARCLRPEQCHQSSLSPHLIDAGLGVQEKQLNSGVVLQIRDALNVEPGRESQKGETQGETRASHENALMTWKRWSEEL